MCKVTHTYKEDHKYKLGVSSDSPISPSAVSKLLDVPFCETTYGRIENNILSLINYPETNEYGFSYDEDGDVYSYINKKNKTKTPLYRTIKEIADDLEIKASNVLPESNRRKALFRKASAKRKKETLEERIDREKKIKRRDLNKKIRIKATKQRRKEFNLKRPQLILKMLANDLLYECAVDGCKNEDITVDHKTPLSLGGSDELENLQFLCTSHNSIKGVK